MAIHWIDLVIIVVYLLGITGVGLWFSRHQRGSSTGYFLASRSLLFAVVFFSVPASAQPPGGTESDLAFSAHRLALDEHRLDPPARLPRRLGENR